MSTHCEAEDVCAPLHPAGCIQGAWSSRPRSGSSQQWQHQRADAYIQEHALQGQGVSGGVA